MIGQHIYSRCLEGYFSKSGLNADSTTVTISINMFAREEQAKRIARECEKFSTLEDTRAVPVETQGAYRGVLKIRRLNRQLTMVSRSYRLHSEQELTGGGESRDFTYSSSYILSGEEKLQFLRHPEYCLNIQDFEPYPSVMRRVEESRENGYNGRIEASDSYSLFRSPCRDRDPYVFQKAGFTKQLFAEYISSVIQRVSYSHYSGHEKDKVLVILPQQFNMPWVRCGGNGFAEEILSATIKILPECVRSQLNATTGGMRDPDAFVLEGYQLVFMEPGSTKDWRKSEYSVIDLERQESFVTDSLDTKYGEFLWDFISEEETRNNFENQYLTLFGVEQSIEGDNSPEKFSLALHLFQEEAENFANERNRSRMLAELVDYCGNCWTERAIDIALQALKREVQEPGYDKVLEETFLELIQGADCPEELKELLVESIVQNILHGDAGNRSILWVCKGIQNQDTMILKKVIEANQQIVADTETQWYKRKSLMDFYFNICGNPEIHTDTKVKREVLSILTNWYMDFLGKNDWENCVMITQILSEQLEDTRLETEGRREIYQDLIYLLFFGEGDGRKQISDILKREERKFSSESQNKKMFWECFRNQLQSEDISINEDVIWQMTYLAVSQDEVFLQYEWEPLYRYMVGKFGFKYRTQIFETTREYFFNWIKNIQSAQKLKLVYRGIAISEMDNIEYGKPYYVPEIEDLRGILSLLEENGMTRDAAKLLYMRYQVVNVPEKREYFFEKELDETEQWKIILVWILRGESDPFLNNALIKLEKMRKGFLHVVADFEWEDEKEVEKAAKMYFYLLQHYIRDTYDASDSLYIWCDIYRIEIRNVADASRGTEFSSYIKQYFKFKMAEQKPLSVRNLKIEDVLFLKKAGMLPLGEGWECLDILSDIYTMDAGGVSEEFLSVREKIIKEKDAALKQIYLEALEKKNVLLLKRSAEGEVIYNIALLEEQLSLELTHRADFSLINVAQKIWGKAERSEKLITALYLLSVIRYYGTQASNVLNAYNCSIVRKQLFKETARIAKISPESFANKSVLRAYKKLNKEDKNLMLQCGLEQCLYELPREWQEEYGIREEKSRMEIVLPSIFAGVFLLLGIGAEILFFFLYGRIGVQVAVIVGIVLAAIGVIGDVIVLICILVSRKKVSNQQIRGREKNEMPQV